MDSEHEDAMEVRRLGPDDAAKYVSIRREALLQHPLAFGASPEDDLASSIESVRRACTSTDQAIFGAFAPGLVGTAGVYRDRGRKAAHKCHVWGVYVSPPCRGRGIGRILVEAAVRFAWASPAVTQVQLSVSESATEALALYRSLGFTTWGVEPGALRIGEVEVAEHHMVLTRGR